MKIIMVAAISKDGFLTRGDEPNPSHWTSDEDKAHIQSMIANHALQVFGSKTYDVYQLHPNKDILRVILTRSPDQYVGKEVTGQIEFKTLSPVEFKTTYDDRYESCLLLGGGSVYRQFLDAGVVDELYLTIEPINNESGASFFRSGESLADLHLPEPIMKQLNDTGTELRHYILKK
jgi:dihydrofolate reductase